MLINPFWRIKIRRLRILPSISDMIIPFFQDTNIFGHIITSAPSFKTLNRLSSFSNTLNNISRKCFSIRRHSEPQFCYFRNNSSINQFFIVLFLIISSFFFLWFFLFNMVKRVKFYIQRISSRRGFEFFNLFNFYKLVLNFFKVMI